MEKVIVLNADYSFLNTISWQTAISLYFKGKADVVKWTDRVVHSAGDFEMNVPSVIRLIKMVRQIFKSKVPYAKRNVFIRDNYKCGYCRVDIPERECTVDHIIPRAQGGKSTWENCITSCYKCNNKKEDKTPRQARMPLRMKAYQPTISEFIRIYMKKHGVEEILKDLWT